MKKISLIIFTSFLSFNMNAQNIELKDDKIFLDKKEILSYTKKNRNTEFTILKLNSKEEIMFVTDCENETIGYRKDDYYKINFLPLKLKLESTNIKSSWKGLVKWLFENNIFDAEGNLNQEKIEIFIEKYDEHITERTSR